MSIGVLGGTFNPIHLGHLIMAEYVKEEINLDKIIFVPAGNPPLKDDVYVSKEDRFHMVSISIKDNEDFIISDIEMNKEGKSYTYDTLREIKKQFPNEEIFFLLGEDAAKNFKQWYKFEEIVTENNIIIMNRGEDFETKIVNDFKYLKPRFQLVETPFINISSTEIRRRIKNGLSVKYMVKDEVNNYIKEKGLYL